MDKPAVSSHDAIPLSDEPYAGLPGQTRYDSVHLVEPDGGLRSIAVCRAINTRTHPELKARALTGLLHRLEDGRELAVSFVYHDPDARKFALVLPSALAHLELKEWSKLMAEIAEDTRRAVPIYVREMTTVLGVAALARFIQAEGDADAEPERSRSSLPLRLELSERETLLLQRERELAEQEYALVQMADGLTQREADLGRLHEQLDTARIDLDIREAELRDRDGTREDLRRIAPRTGNWQELGVRAIGERDAGMVFGGHGALEASVAGSAAGMTRRAVGDATLHASRERHDAEGVAHGPRSMPPPLPLAQRSRSGPPPLPHPRKGAPPPLTVRRELDEARAGLTPRSTRPPPLPSHDALVTDPTDPEPEVAPPEPFASLRPGQLALTLSEDELWLFVQLEEAHASSFRHGADLTLQYVEQDGYPVVVLSLVDHASSVYAVRYVLDGHSESDVRVLEHLSRSFRGRIALYVDRLYTETVTAAVLREGVAQAIRAKIAALPEARPTIAASDALARVLHAPPPLWNDDLPFGPARREAPSTVTVLAAVEQLVAWLRPEKLSEATLTYGVPRHVVEATIRRIARSAISFGVALPDSLLRLAVEHGAASDEQAVLRDQLRSFRQRVEQRQNDLEPAATRTNWQQLLAAAEARGVEIDEATRRLATPAGADAHTGEAPTPRVHAQLSAAELEAKLQEPGERLEVIRELCVRGQPGAIAPLLFVLDLLEPPELVCAVAGLARFGEAAADGLLAALGSPSGPVRQCAALALGKLRLRRALVPLLELLAREETAIFPELARAFGDFGAAALPSVLKAIPASARPDRLALALAHLANHGSAKEVEKLENDPDGALAQAARKAMARRSRMEWEDLAVREQRPLSDASAATRLSQAFYAEAAKTPI